MPSTAVRNVILNSYVCSEARAFLARTTALDSRHRNAYIKLINGLVADGVWAKLDVLYMFATQDETNALLNLVSSSFTGTATGSPVFTADRGYQGATNKFIDTGYNPTTAGLNYTQNAAHISFFSNNEVAASAVADMGLRTSGGTISQISCEFTGSVTLYNINDNVVNAAGTANTSAAGFFLANRSGASAQEGYRNGIDQGVVAVASDAMTNSNFLVLARRLAPATNETNSTKQVSVASIGGSLTADQAMKFYQRVRTYNTTMGVP